MKKQVREALSSIRDDMKNYDGEEKAMVYTSELETLLAWAEKKRDNPGTGELAVGARVKLRIDWMAKPYTRVGSKGTVTRLNVRSNQDFPYEVTLDGHTEEGDAVSFARHELKRIRG